MGKARASVSLFMQIKMFFEVALVCFFKMADGRGLVCCTYFYLLLIAAMTDLPAAFLIIKRKAFLHPGTPSANIYKGVFMK